jgi:hypothetical protein
MFPKSREYYTCWKPLKAEALTRWTCAKGKLTPPDSGEYVVKIFKVSLKSDKSNSPPSLIQNLKDEAYEKGYNAGLYALQSQVPSQFLGMWERACEAEKKKHFEARKSLHG